MIREKGVGREGGRRGGREEGREGGRRGGGDIQLAKVQTSESETECG